MNHKHFSEEEIILFTLQENNLSIDEIKCCLQCDDLYKQYAEILNSTKLAVHKLPDYSLEKIKNNVLQKLTAKNKELLPNIFKFSLYPALAVAIILLLILPYKKNKNNLSSEETQIVQNIEILQNVELLDNLNLFLNEDLDEDNALINSNGD